jgi:thymidylate synthase
MIQYLDLVRHVLTNGNRKENRTGVDTLSTFGYYYEHDLREGFPLLTTKKIAWKNIVIELLWFLSGSNRNGFLERHNCGFWRPWYNEPTHADKFAADDKGVTVNAAYGPAWRRFEYPAYYESDSGLSCGDGPCTGYFDQIAWAVDRLQTKPMDRAIVISAWQPHIATRPPSKNAYWAPCHCMWILNVQNEELYEQAWDVYDHPTDGKCVGFVTAATEEEATQKAREKFSEDGVDDDIVVSGGRRAVTVQGAFSMAVAKSKRHNPVGHPEGWLAEPMVPIGSRQRLCLHLTQRSADALIGVPYNIASYALLLSLFARFSGIEPGIFGHTLVDAHIYTAKSDGSKAEYDHIPGALEQLSRKPRPLPKLTISDDIKSLEDVERLLHPSVTTEEIMSKFILEGYDPWPSIPFRVAV